MKIVSKLNIYNAYSNEEKELPPSNYLRLKGLNNKIYES